MLVTHGGDRKAKRFDWIFQNDYVRIKNENGRQAEWGGQPVRWFGVLSRAVKN